MAEQQRQAGPEALSVVLGLAQRARRARTIEELNFAMVNETKALVQYRQAMLWTDQDGVVAVSGVATAERNAPFTIWLDRLLRAVADRLDAPRKLVASDVAASEREQWSEWLPAHLLLLPLRTPDREPLGVLGFARDKPWSEAEILFLVETTEAYALAWAWRRRPGIWQGLRARFARLPRRGVWVIAAVAAICVIPVRLSVLAPGDVVARDPAVIRAPLEGVVDKVYVQPNQPVTKGELLFALDTTATHGKLEVAQKALATANAEYEQTVQQAFFDAKAKAQLGVLAGHVGERKAEIAYLDDLMARSQVKAPRDGVAVLDDPSEWTGRPVIIGEKVLAIADEHDTELEGWLAPADMIDLPPGSRAVLFLNVDPLAPVRATLRYIAYEGDIRPDATVAHRLRATLDGDAGKPRLGLKGTVRLDGGQVPLAYWLLRRPWAVVRQTIGF